MPTIFQRVITLTGRILLSAVFISGGAHHLVDWRSAAAQMTAHGMAMEDQLGAGGTAFVHVLLALAVVLMLAGGLSVLLGVFARFGAVLLLTFLIPATIVFHDFWAINPATDLYQQQMSHFMKNLALMGGLLLVLAFGSGGFSIQTLLTGRRRSGDS